MSLSEVLEYTATITLREAQAQLLDNFRFDSAVAEFWTLLLESNFKQMHLTPMC